ncbi:MAG: hypothetical protein ACE5R6_02935 [Candidatus Heimdallarchaeota archaeon]
MKPETIKDSTFKHLLRAVFASIKNSRRRAILNDLCTFDGLTIKRITRNLRKRGYQHSRSTVLEYYVKPLQKGKLIEKKGEKFKITYLGEKIKREVKPIETYLNLLNQGKCYEEFFLISLALGLNTYEQLTEIVPFHTISRIEKRIDPFLQKAPPRTYYYVTDEGKNGNLLSDIPSTGREIFHLIQNNGGIRVPDLFALAQSRPRTCYKHLKRLRERGLIRRQKQPVTFNLTSAGKKVAEALYRIAEHCYFEMQKFDSKSLIIDYLSNRDQPVAPRNLIKVLDNYFMEHYGRLPELYEFEQLIAEMKLENLLVGNRQSGYTLIQTAQLEKNIFQMS